MSLITRCPTCETLFKVVPDQLRISEGWVRCGQCDDIFDASLHLLPLSPAEEIPVVLRETPAGNVELLESTDLRPEPLGAATEPECKVHTEASALVHELLESVPADDEIKPIFQELIQEELTPVHEDTLLTAALAAPEVCADASGDEFDDRAELSEVSFLHGKRHDSFWLKPIMRVTLIFLSLVLLLGLVGQIARYERDRIAALAPGLKPWLLAICTPLNCTLSPLRRIESIVIESSSFTKMKGDAYRLSLTIKNSALTPLAVPAIELTLTDTLDQPVVRRVFLAAELGVKSDALTAGAEWPVSLVVAVKAAGASDRVAGYRLLAFYP